MSRLQLTVDPGAANHALQGLETFGWKWIAGPDGGGSAIDVAFCYVGTASLLDKDSPVTNAVLFSGAGINDPISSGQFFQPEWKFRWVTRGRIHRLSSGYTMLLC